MPIINPIQYQQVDDLYYLVNGYKTYSKVKAIELAKGNLQSIQFCWSPEIWDKVNWTDEPHETWQVLVDERCRQIRDNYNHVCLWYSSGFDSNTILESFLKQNLLLDEILIVNRTKLYYDPEIEVCYSRANFIKNNYYPNLIINSIDLDYDYIKQFYGNLKEDWIYQVGNSTRFTKTNKYHLTNLYDESRLKMGYRDRGDIIGHDKPKVLLSNGKWYTFFHDYLVNETVSVNHETFYINGNFTKLHIKQVHNAINWFESLPNLNEDLVHEIQGRDKSISGNYTKYYRDWNIAVGRYPIDYYCHPWSSSGVQKFNHDDTINSYDSVGLLQFYKENDKEIYKTYVNGYNRILSLTNNKDPNPSIISKLYYVRDCKKISNII